MTFSIFESDPQTEAQEEAEYLEEANPGDFLVFSGNNQMNTWRKICKKENGVKKWEYVPGDDPDEVFGGKRRRKTMRKKRKRTRKCH